jgi:hypothetical protein
MEGARTPNEILHEKSQAQRHLCSVIRLQRLIHQDPGPSLEAEPQKRADGNRLDEKEAFTHFST